LACGAEKNIVKPKTTARMAQRFRPSPLDFDRPELDLARKN